MDGVSHKFTHVLSSWFSFRWDWLPESWIELPGSERQFRDVPFWNRLLTPLPLRCSSCLFLRHRWTSLNTRWTEEGTSRHAAPRRWSLRWWPRPWLSCAERRLRTVASHRVLLHRLPDGRQRWGRPSQWSFVQAGWGLSIGGVEHVTEEWSETEPRGTETQKVEAYPSWDSGCHTGRHWPPESQIWLRRSVAVSENNCFTDGKITSVGIALREGDQGTADISVEEFFSRSGNRVLRATLRGASEAGTMWWSSTESLHHQRKASALGLTERTAWEGWS